MNDLTLSIKFSTVGGQTVVKSVESLGDAVATANQKLKGSQAAGQHAQQGFNQASAGSKKLSSDIAGTSSELTRLRDHMHSMVGIGAMFYTALAAGAQVREYVRLADEFNVLQQRIKTATAETGDYNAVSAEMYAIAQRNGAALQPTVELFQRLSTSRKDLKATNDQMLDFTDAVQKLGVIGGSSTMAMDAGLLQLSQGLSGGILRAEEFNSILENIPELASRIGKGMDDIGKSKTDLGLGDLRKLVLESKLLSDDVLKAILVQLPEIEKQFASMPISVGRAGVMVDNSISAALSRLDQATGSTQAWANVLVDISQTLDNMSAEELNNSIAALLAIAGGGAALLILTKYGLGLANVGAGYSSLIGWLNSYRTVQVATTATVYNAATMTNLTVASNTAAARSFNLLAASAAVGRGALALIGGPVGLAALAAWGIYEFASSSDEAETKAKLMADALGDAATGFKDVGKEAASAKIAENLAKLTDTQADIAGLEKSLASAKAQMDAMGTPRSERQWIQFDAAVAKINRLEEQLKAAKTQQDVLLEANNKLDLLANPVTVAAPGGAADVTALNDQLLKLYNTQMLNAQAIDAQGRALAGVDLELFKAQFKEVTELPKDAEAALRGFAKTAEAAAQLAANDKYLVSLKEEVRLQQIRLTQSEAEYEQAKAMSSQKMTDPAQLKQLKELLTTQQKLTQAKASKDALTALKTENDLMQIKLSKGEKEYELQKLIRELKVSDPAVIAQLDAEIQRQALLNEQLDVRKYLTDGTYDDLLDGLKQVGDMGGAAGNALVDAFGSVADQFARMAEQQDEFTKKFVTLSEARKKAEKETDPARRAKALEKADAVESSLMEDQYRMQMGNYATLTGAASKMFSENSKGRQVMHRMETTFAAIETALALKKAAANALSAITNQGSGDPYTAFARIAAMAAIMAGLGVFSGSASASGASATSQQESQGTGTVLGDSAAKSESIANSLERIESLELDQYAELRSINTSIRELSAGIKNLAVNLVANYGSFDEDSYQGELGKEYNVQLGSGLASFVGGGTLGLVVDKLLGNIVGGLTNKLLGGLFGSTKKELIDSGISFAAQELGDILSSGLVKATLYDTIQTTKKKLFGLSKSTSTSTEYRALDAEVKVEFGRVFSYLGKSVTDAVSLLGLETSKSLEDFVINLPKISFKGLSGDEIEEELNAIFSQQGDLMAKYLVPGIAEFQKMGEGLYDTLIRVAQEQAVFNSSLDALGLQLSRFAGVTKQVEIEVAQSLIELMGGIEEFSSATGKYFEEFYSETEQQAYLAKLINEQFAALNLTMPATREQFKSLIGGIDLTTESGQALFAALMSIIDPLDQFYDGVEDAAKAAEKAAEAEQKLAAERNKFNSDIQSELVRMDFSPFELAMDDLNRWYADAKAEAEALGASTALLAQLYNKKREALATEYMNKSIASAEAAMSSLVADYQRTVEQLGQTLAQVLDSISSMAGSIRTDILNIRKTLPEFDSVSYYSEQVAGLTAQLGTGTATAQLDVIGKLKAAMLDRYSAELEAMEKNMEAINAEQAAREELYETQLEQFNALKEAALAMKDAAAALLYSDLSTLTEGERLQQLQSQYTTAVAKARGGDVEAYGQVQSLGEQLLQMSRDYDPSSYSAVFDSVLGIFNELGGMTFDEPTAPAPHPAIAAYEETKIALARQTIAQLELLAGRTDSLGALATDENTAAVNALTAQFNASTAEVSALLETELAAIRSEMPAQTDVIVEALQQQLDALLLIDKSVRDGTLPVLPVMREVADNLDVSNSSLSSIAIQVANPPAPIVVPAPTVDVVVNVTYTPPPENPGGPTEPNVVAELQTLQQITLATNSAIQQLTEANETMSRELADSNAQLMALQRVS